MKKKVLALTLTAAMMAMLGTSAPAADRVIAADTAFNLFEYTNADGEQSLPGS